MAVKIPLIENSNTAGNNYNDNRMTVSIVIVCFSCYTQCSEKNTHSRITGSKKTRCFKLVFL